jgi:hypothetical protein
LFYGIASPATVELHLKTTGMNTMTTTSSRLLKYLAVVLLALHLAGCASPLFDVGRSETVLPLSKAWVNNRVVEYVITDISDAAMAQQSGVNYVPHLRNALAGQGRQSLVERVYKFPGAEQISIFQSAPLPTGPGNTDQSYSPLWRLVLVRWVAGQALRELKSEEELFRAQDKGEVSIEVTDIVVNCPITRGADSKPLKGVR